MKKIDNLIVIDKKELKEKIEKLKILKNKAIQEETYQIACWLQGRIESIKFVLSESSDIKDIITDIDRILNEHHVSDDFQIGTDGAYENVDEWGPEFMDGQNKDTWFDELDINPHWKKNLKKYNLSPEVWNVICRLYYGETIALKNSLEEQKYLTDRYQNLKRNIESLLD